MEDVSEFKYKEGEMETRKTKKLSIYIALKKKKKYFVTPIRLSPKLGLI